HRRDHRLPVFGQFLPRKRTAQALAELSDNPIGNAATAMAAGALGEFQHRLREAIAGGAVVNLDETGFRVEGTNPRIDSPSTSRYSLMTAHRRGPREHSTC